MPIRERNDDPDRIDDSAPSRVLQGLKRARRFHRWRQPVAARQVSTQPRGLEGESSRRNAGCDENKKRMTADEPAPRPPSLGSVALSCTANAAPIDVMTK